MTAIKNPKTECSKREKFIDEFGGKNDEVYTPEEAILPLIPYLDKKQTIWDCAYGGGRLAEHFKKHGFKVVGHKEIDFLEKRNPKESLKYDFDVIITNPPYSYKDKFLEKAFKLGIPFAFLLPVDAIGSQKRVRMFMNNEIQLIIPHRRINFEIPSGKNSNWFHSMWLCYKLNLPKQLNFVELNNDK